MITANELRIGNWLTHNGEPFQVGTADISDLVLDNTVHEPIPLTHELLAKAGFIKTSIKNPFFDMYHLDLGRDRHLSVHNPGTPNEIIFLSEGSNYERNTIAIRNFDYDGKTYLHHLQNIIHALTNQELTINL